MFRIGDAVEDADANAKVVVGNMAGYLEELTVFGDFDADDPDFAPLPNSRPRSRCVPIMSHVAFQNNVHMSVTDMSKKSKNRLRDPTL